MRNVFKDLKQIQNPLIWLWINPTVLSQVQISIPQLRVSADTTAVFVSIKPVNLTEQHDVSGKTENLFTSLENVLETAASVSEV